MSERITLSPEEMDALRSILTKERPLCWYCEFCPTPERRKDSHCYPPGQNWREATRTGKCADFRPVRERLGARREERVPRVEQLGIEFNREVSHEGPSA